MNRRTFLILREIELGNQLHTTRNGKVQKKKSTKTTNKSRKRTKGRRKQTSYKMPKGLFYVLTVLLSIVFLAAFFYFFIRPYSYRWKPCYGMKAYGVCMPSGNYIHGIDLSHYQGDIRWYQLAEVRKGPFPVQFMFIKATEGATVIDGLFSKNRAAAKSAGLMVGAYHFLTTSSDAESQFSRPVGEPRAD